MKYEFDLDFLVKNYSVTVNGEKYVGKLAIGDTLTVNGVSYAVQGLNEDGIVVKEIV